MGLWFWQGFWRWVWFGAAGGLKGVGSSLPSSPQPAFELSKHLWRCDMKSLKHLLLIGATALSAGCGIEAPQFDTGCDWVMPIRPSHQDQLTDGTVAQILAHNEVWEEVCAGINSAKIS